MNFAKLITHDEAKLLRSIALFIPACATVAVALVAIASFIAG